MAFHSFDASELTELDSEIVDNLRLCRKLQAIPKVSLTSPYMYEYGYEVS